MDDESPHGHDPIPPEALVAHAGFVRRLAGALLRDDADADDAAQEALAAGASRGPRLPGARAAWLATIVRRVASRMRRSAGRRAAREARAARPEAASPTDALAAREETLRAVVTAIRRLDAAAREVVLLRHYDDLPPRAMAERLGVPVETVKSRLRRAHERLRVLLESEGPGAERRRKTLAGFAGVPFVPRSQPLAGLAASGATASAAGKAVGIAAVVLLGAGVTVWAVAQRSGDPGIGGSDGSHASTPLAAGSPPNAGRPSLAARPPERAPQIASAEQARIPEGWIHRTIGDLEIAVPPDWVESPLGPGEVSWASTAPLADATWDFEIRRRFPVEHFLARNEPRASGSRQVDGRAATWRMGNVTLLTDPGEYFLVTLDGAEGSPPVFLSYARRPARVTDRRSVFEQVLDTVRFPGAVGDVEGVELDERELGRFIVPVGAALDVEALVLRGDRPLPGAIVEVYAQNEDRPWTSVATDDRGLARITAAARRTAQIAVRARDSSARWWRGDPAELRRRLLFPLGRRSVEGHAFDATGRPLAGASIRMEPRVGVKATAVTTTDGHGWFRLDGLVAGDYTLSALDPAPGSGVVPVRRELVTLRKLDESVRVDLGSDAPDVPWRFTLRLASGTPVRAGEMVILSRDGAVRMTETGADGTMGIVLPPGRWRASLASGESVLAVVGGGATGGTTWRVPGVRVSGVVRGMEVGEDAVVECREQASTSPRVERVHGTSFALEPVAPGPHLLSVRIGNRVSAPREVVVPEDRDVTGLVLDAP